jgi:hypothetical protein
MAAAAFGFRFEYLLRCGQFFEKSLLMFRFDLDQKAAVASFVLGFHEILLRRLLSDEQCDCGLSPQIRFSSTAEWA